MSRVLALGVLLATLIATTLLAAGPAHASTTFTVNSTADDGDLTPGNGECYTGVDVAAGVKGCTLRAAIEEANATATTADIIEFDIPGGGVKTITPATALPKITGPVTVNGYSQPGAKLNSKAVGSDALLRIELSGANCPNCDGLVLGSSNSTVKGLVINRWSLGIRIDGPAPTGNKLTGNFIGTDASGTQKLGNSRGVYIPDAANNTIGGATAAERNLISSNAENGIAIDEGARGNKVIGNYLGTDRSGTKDLGNGTNGINIEGAPGTIIGGTTAGTRNVISGNDEQGVAISGAGGNKVQGNFVGTDATGARDLGNDDNGVTIGDAPNTTVGGTTAAARNVISGNAFAGVYIYGAASTGNKVMGNYLGTDRSGTKDLGNYHGVLVYDAPDNTIGGTTAAERNVASGNTYGVFIGGNLSNPTATGNEVVGNYLGTDASGTRGIGNSYGVFISYAPGNTIGGTTAGARNIVSANTLSGVTVSGDSATANRILSNSIFNNVRLGIDLGENGPTANDLNDADTGPNNFQNFPVLTSARTVSAKTTIGGTLDSTPNKTFTLQFFSSPTADPSGYGEGKTYLGQKAVTTDAGGNVSFTYNPTSGVTVGNTITATATGAGNTSEFSRGRRVVQ